MKKILCAMIISLIVAGCATQTVKLGDAKSTPQDRVYLKDEIGSGVAEIIIIRDTGFLGSACLAQVFLDGNLAASMKTSEKVSFKIGDGDHIIGVTLKGGGLCSFSADLQERELKVKSGEKKYYRVFSDPSGTPLIMPTTQAY